MYAVVLRQCPEEITEKAAAFLTAAFSVKEGTATAVLGSAPIILVDDLSLEEAAVLQLILQPFEMLGAGIQLEENPSPELPKIDWPEKPRIFKQSLSTHVKAASIEVPLPTGGGASVLNLLVARLKTQADETMDGLIPTHIPDPGSGLRQAVPSALTANHPAGQDAPPPPADAAVPSTHRTDKQVSTRSEFRGADLGEITPFSNPALPAMSGPQTAASTNTEIPAAPSDEDVGARMDELFGQEDSDLIPKTQDITNILNQLLPDESGQSQEATVSNPGSSSSQLVSESVAKAVTNGHAGGGGGDFSVFLAKIADPARRERATPLLAELANISEDEAANLAKKVIIPVLRGVSKDEAEQAKHRFAEIGVLARIKQG